MRKYSKKLFLKFSYVPTYVEESSKSSTRIVVLADFVGCSPKKKQKFKDYSQPRFVNKVQSEEETGVFASI